MTEGQDDSEARGSPLWRPEGRLGANREGMSISPALPIPCTADGRIRDQWSTRAPGAMGRRPHYAPRGRPLLLGGEDVGREQGVLPPARPSLEDGARVSEYTNLLGAVATH
jgi:hypothetical protein